MLSWRVCRRSLATTRLVRSDPKLEYPEHAQLYPNHIPTSLAQKTILALGSSLMALSDPWRADMVAVNGEVTGGLALNRMYNKMDAHPEGQQILRLKPRINTTTVDFDALRDLPPDSLGFTYATYSDDHKITPDSRDTVQFVDDVELAYVMQRYRETHDLVHAVLDMPTNMVGEVAVKWVEALQTGLPMCVGGAVLGPIRFSPKQIRQFRRYRPWAVRVGLNSEFLLNVFYERRWDQDMDDFRREMRIEPKPF
ncbi:hypothetical protein TCAL_05707 [Tigriopus californicus]|uniref:Ubiquinone biosynthesis protein COQ4 homolog, mitochondrial n=1 Tax=Tigriopus californicus TaxID=6832 RepID=A0A553N6L5_TIGCA|nr:ubiquinone biosynthesis protein COQ4 homolog, mitochondrial-like [Tigriopus californicus]TRY61079.1 hypothetical protein TCAL_05707 [Tigriopus californicus]|eukprot:TCALIF_05707-PA protein Name:"Similar to Ubiquinone biosynthesis protein COQ4 homolog, mitochondrial (Bombyx mori)" AED:0.30 eAED:0.30 QI:0/-1/0/1/-1/1/1/0/252